MTTIREDAHRPEFHRAAPPQLPVRCATTANITIATALNAGDTIDGVTLAAGDRVLVKDQSTGAQNGIYVAGVTPARAFDMLEGVAAMGAVIYVIAGTTNGGQQFVNTNTTLPTIDTTALTFSAMSGGSGAPTTADYLTGTAQAGLSAEIVVGTTPGGELGGTWASPTVDATHSGSAHTDFIAKSTYNAKGDLISASANDTPSLLTVGADDTILMADAAQTAGLKWVGSQTPSTQAFGDAASQGTADTYSRGDHKHAMPADPGGSSGSVEVQPFYGDGHDGDATISVDTTITKDMFYNNLTVNSGIFLDTALLRIFVKGTLTLTGTIRCNGNNGGAGGNGTAGAGGAAGAAGTQQTGGSVTNLPNGSIGRAGAVGGINANGSGTTAGSSTTYGFPSVPAGTAGGQSGSGRSGGAGGAAGSSVDTIQDHPLMWPRIIEWRRISGTIINYDTVGGIAAQAGSGGGAAASGGGGSGGSGSSGGFVVICARVITGSGTIQAKGGNGGNGGNGLATAQAGGGAGGNGGQGGVCVLISKDSTGWSGSFDVAGGTKGTKGLAGGGAGSTDGADGNNGGAGKSYQMKMG